MNYNLSSECVGENFEPFRSIFKIFLTFIANINFWHKTVKYIANMKLKLNFFQHFGLNCYSNSEPGPNLAKLLISCKHILIIYFSTTSLCHWMLHSILFAFCKSLGLIVWIMKRVKAKQNNFWLNICA